MEATYFTQVAQVLRYVSEEREERKEAPSLAWGHEYEAHFPNRTLAAMITRIWPRRQLRAICSICLGTAPAQPSTDAPEVLKSDAHTPRIQMSKCGRNTHYIWYTKFHPVEAQSLREACRHGWQGRPDGYLILYKFLKNIATRPQMQSPQQRSAEASSNAKKSPEKPQHPSNLCITHPAP